MVIIVPPYPYIIPSLVLPTPAFLIPFSLSILLIFIYPQLPRFLVCSGLDLSNLPLVVLVPLPLLLPPNPASSPPQTFFCVARKFFPENFSLTSSNRLVSISAQLFLHTSRPLDHPNSPCTHSALYRLHTFASHLVEISPFAVLRQQSSVAPPKYRRSVRVGS